MKNARKSPKSLKKNAGMSIPSVLMALAIGAIVVMQIAEEYKAWQQSNDVEELAIATRKVGNNLEVIQRQWKHFNGFGNADVYNSPALYTDSLKSPVANQFNTPYGDNSVTYVAVNTVTNRSGKVFTSPSAKPMWVSQKYAGITTEACYMFVDKIIGEALEIKVGGVRVATNATKKSECDKAGDTTGVLFEVIM